MTEAKTVNLLVDSFAGRGSKTAVLSMTRGGKQELSYAQLGLWIRQLAAGLQNAGLRPGQTVLIASGNCPEWIVACLAVVYCGAIAVPMDSNQSDKDLEHIVNDSGAGWAFVDRHASERLDKLAARQMRIFRLDTKDEEGSWRRLLSEAPLPAFAAGENDIAIMFYTSGTTGQPKGVPLTHKNIMSQLDSALSQLHFLKPEDRMLLPLPFYHVYPLNMGIMGPLRLGLTIILPRSLTGPQIRRALNEGQATTLVAVPRLLRAVYSAIEARFYANRLSRMVFDGAMALSSLSRDWLGLKLGPWIFQPVRNKFAPSLRLMTCGGAMLEARLCRKLEALGWEVVVGYGLTETAPLLAVRLPGNNDLDSVGQPIPGVEIRISTGEGRSTKESEGQVEARGDNVFAGYHNLKHKSEESFTPDEWFKTGDMGYFKDGNLHITGRGSTTIVLEGGKKFQPDDVEETFNKQPGIQEIALLQYQHKLVALVVPDPHTIDGKDSREAMSKVLTAASSRLPSHMHIVDFAVSREPLPRTNLGKLKRYELPECYKSARSGQQKQRHEQPGLQPIQEMSSEDRALVQDPVANQCWRWLGQRFPQVYLTLDKSPQLDLNVDSLEWLNLTLEIQQSTNVELSEDAVAKIATVRDLLREIVSASESSQPTQENLLDDPERFLNENDKRYLQPLDPARLVLAWLFYHFVAAVMRRMFKLKVEGAENLPEGQMVLIPNHVSFLDPFAVIASLSFKRLRQTQWASWVGVAFANPFYSFMSRLAQAIPVEPKHSLMTSLALAAMVLKQNKSLVWFPEGRRSLTGELIEFKPGIGMLLEKSSIPVVPVYLKGTREALPPGSYFPRFSGVTVIFGKPVEPQQLAKEGEGDSVYTRIANALRSRIAKLKKDKG